MSNPWNINSVPSTAAQATATQAAPAGGLAAGLILRLRSIVAAVATGATAQTPLQWVIRDGASGSGTILRTGVVAAPANSGDAMIEESMDVRASPGNALTVEFTAAGVTASQESVSASGDIIPQGYPIYQS